MQRARWARTAARSSSITAGEGTVDITPPLGIELAGFFRPPGDERLITGIRQPSAARALVLRHKDLQVAIVSVDITGVSREFARQTRRLVAERTGIPAENVRICATHSHSMPTFRFCRYCGGISNDYMGRVQERIVDAVGQAQTDLAPAEVYLGTERVKDGNYNRTTKNWKTDEQFDEHSTDADRWLDSMLHVLLFRRGEGKQDLLWYHFSAHPACSNDHLAGPCWPGLVVKKTIIRNNLAPSFLQGHCGDVHAGCGQPRLGDPEKVSDAVQSAIRQAIEGAEPVKIDTMRIRSARVEVPLDVARLKEELEFYRENPRGCEGDAWLNPEFAADWAASASRWDLSQATLQAPISAVKIGSVGLLFHPAELYSYYGLAIRRASPLEHTLVVGYTDDCIGYLCDANAYKDEEYAALLAPKILDLPPFTADAARRLAAGALELLREVTG